MRPRRSTRAASRPCRAISHPRRGACARRRRVRRRAAPSRMRRLVHRTRRRRHRMGTPVRRLTRAISTRWPTTSIVLAAISMRASSPLRRPRPSSRRNTIALERWHRHRRSPATQRRMRRMPNERCARQETRSNASSAGDRRRRKLRIRERTMPRAIGATSARNLARPRTSAARALSRLERRVRVTDPTRPRPMPRMSGTTPPIARLAVLRIRAPLPPRTHLHPANAERAADDGGRDAMMMWFSAGWNPCASTRSSRSVHAELRDHRSRPPPRHLGTPR